MPIHGAAMSLMLKKGRDQRREDELWKAFTEADKNKDGYLSVEEYIGVFHNHGISISQEEVSVHCMCGVQILIVHSRSV